MTLLSKSVIMTAVSPSTSQWRTIRGLRANPPAAAAAHERRRRVFQASLAQAEELWEAASVVGPASRPLPLFYSLSQAGRAICAAWKADEPWEPRGHGLTIRQETENPSELIVRPRAGAQGAFSMVAGATDSATFSGDVTIAELWASLPDFPHAEAIIGDAPRWLRLEATSSAGFVEASWFAMNHGILSDVAEDELDAVLERYPTAAGYQQVGARVDPLGGVSAVVSFPRADGTLRPMSDVGDPLSEGGALPRYYALRPRLGSGDGEPPSQLMTLWGLLFGLSNLARYHPEVWINALDPDASEVAVQLEAGMETALEKVPALLLPALKGSPLVSRAAREGRLAPAEPATSSEPATEAGEEETN